MAHVHGGREFPRDVPTARWTSLDADGYCVLGKRLIVFSMISPSSPSFKEKTGAGCHDIRMRKLVVGMSTLLLVTPALTQAAIFCPQLTDNLYQGTCDTTVSDDLADFCQRHVS